MCPLPPVQFRAVPLDPPPYGRVVNPDTPLRQKFRYLAVRQAEAQVPTDGAQDDLRFEVPPPEQKRTTEHGPFSLPFFPFKSLQHNPKCSVKNAEARPRLFRPEHDQLLPWRGNLQAEAVSAD